MLAEGQRDGDIEVLQIDVKASTVRVMNHGIPETLDFANNGAKLANVPPPMASPLGLPQPTGIPLPPPNAQRSLPPGMRRALSNATGADPNAASQANAGYGSSQEMPPNPNGFPHLDPDTQKIMMEVERQRTAEAVKGGMLPPIPPTILTPSDSPDFIPAPPDIPDL
jgi:hypothetical protein